MIKSTINTYFAFLQYLKVNKDALFDDFLKEKNLISILHPDFIKSYYQPIMSLEDRDTIGFEVLNRPPVNPVFPTVDKFYDYVGKSRSCVTAEYFLRDLSLERYTKQIQDQKQHKDKLVFLNIQPQVLAHPSYKTGQTLELLAKHGLSPNQIVLELTEKEAVMDYSQFEGIISHYRQQGFRIAVDDAGTGYNSLKTLVYLKPEFVKIDKSLIRNIHSQPAQQHLVQLIADFAFQSGTKIVAEGIETCAEFRFLKMVGVHMGQGYALGKPEESLYEGQLPYSKNDIQMQFA